MSEYIPFHIQIEIMKRLPVKSLLQFRSVSKQWKTFIDSSEFISAFKVRQTHPHRLLVRYKDAADTKEKYVWFVDDDDDDEAFSQQELAPTVPQLSKFVDDIKLVGSSQGLLCFYQDPGKPQFEIGEKMAFVWNPSIRKSVCIPVPDLSDTVVGFGVCSITGDPTIVKIRNLYMYNYETVDDSPMVEVFTLSRGSWRAPSSNWPKISILVTWSQVVIDNNIYWLAFDRDVTMEFMRRKNLIVSFDMTTEEFRVIDLPDNFAYEIFDRVTLSVSKVCDSLAVLKYIKSTDPITELDSQVCEVWIMDRTIPNSFIKLFTINKPRGSLKILGFTMRGQPIMETQDDDYNEPAALVVYETTSEHINETGIYGKGGSLFVSSYMETLLLLDHPNCSVFSLGPRRRVKEITRDE